MSDGRYRSATQLATRPAPEPPLVPRSRRAKRRRDRRRDPWWARLLVIFGALMMLASGGAIVASEYAFHRVGSHLQEANLLGDSDARKDNSGRAIIDGPLNVMLLGSDYRDSYEDTWRTDTIIMLHIPRTHDQAFLISFQRDTRVEIPGCGTDKINAAFPCGGGGEKGVQKIAQTLKNLTGMPFDAAALIDFYGFTKVVDELGGVRMYIEKDITSIHPPKRKFTKGWHELDSHAALDYVRQRYQFDDGDFARMRHQQQFLKAIMKRAVEKGYMYNPIKLDKLIKVAGKALFLDLNDVPVKEYVDSLRNIRPDNLTAITVPVAARDIGGISFQELTPDAQALFQAIREERVAEWAINHAPFVNANLDGGP